MLFAAGLGTRMMPLTQTRPKPLVEVAGRPLIDHAIEIVREAGIRKVVANIHYRSEMLERHLEGTEVSTIFETELLDTGGGVLNALPLLGADVVVTLNTDAVWRGDNPISALLDAWRPDRMEAMMLLVRQDRASGHLGSGDFSMDGDGRLIRGPDFVFTGAQIMKTGRLNAFQERMFSLNLIWNGMVDERTLFGLEYGGAWCDVGQPECIELAEGILDV